jgi:hypothetical protein
MAGGRLHPGTRKTAMAKRGAVADKRDAAFARLSTLPVERWEPWELDPGKLPKRPPGRPAAP